MPGVAFPIWEYPVLEVSTGTTPGGDVRALDASAAQDTTVELIVTHTSCRPLHIDVIELARAEVP